MPGYLFSNSLLMLERAMDYQWTKFSVISDNIVNAETPNYKPKYIRHLHGGDYLLLRGGPERQHSFLRPKYRPEGRLRPLRHPPLSAHRPCGGGGEYADG